jgi:hypothetical protein
MHACVAVRAMVSSHIVKALLQTKSLKPSKGVILPKPRFTLCLDCSSISCDGLPAPYHLPPFVLSMSFTLGIANISRESKDRLKLSKLTSGQKVRYFEDEAHHCLQRQIDALTSRCTITTRRLHGSKNLIVLIHIRNLPQLKRWHH